MSLACEFVPSRRLFLPRHLCFACAHVWALGAESTPHLLGALRHACQALAVPCQLLHPEPTHLPPPPDGRASERRGDEDEALDWYEKAVDLDPKCWRALFHVGKISLQFGWAADAADYFKQVAGIEPSHAPTQAFLKLLDESGADLDDLGAGAGDDDETAEGELPVIELPDLPPGMGDIKL